MTTISRYQLNHPKSYVGYAVALHVGGSREAADELTDEHITSATGMARRGAQNMGLVDSNDYTLTEHGEAVAGDVPKLLGVDDHDAVLEWMDDLRGTRGRFVEEFDAAESLYGVARGDDTINTLVNLLTSIYTGLDTNPEEADPIPMPDLFQLCWNRDRLFTARLFLRPDQFVLEAVVGVSDLDEAEESALTLDPEPIKTNDLDGEAVYRSSTVYQLKNVCWHMGVLQSKGTQSDEIDDPYEQTWALEPAVFDDE